MGGTNSFYLEELVGAHDLLSYHLNAWCGLAKSLKRKDGFTDTGTEPHLVYGITPLFSMTAFQ
jgi:hypothetical protein